MSQHEAEEKHKMHDIGFTKYDRSNLPTWISLLVASLLCWYRSNSIALKIVYIASLACCIAGFNAAAVSRVAPKVHTL
jgi:hypothetical protein